MFQIGTRGSKLATTQAGHVRDWLIDAGFDSELHIVTTAGDTNMAPVERIGVGVFTQALREALGDKHGITRFGDALVPLDEALAQAVVDLSGRPYCVHSGESEAQATHLIGGHFTGSLTRHVFESLAHHAAICLHIRVIEGRDPHHIVEAQFKALARALRAACAPDDRVLGVPSTKGAL